MHSYVHNTAVDVAKLFETEESSAMSAVIEHEALNSPMSALVAPSGRTNGNYSGGIDGNCAGIGCFIWLLSAKKYQPKDPMMFSQGLFMVRMSHPACNCRVSNLCGGGPSDPILPSGSASLANCLRKKLQQSVRVKVVLYW